MATAFWTNFIGQDETCPTSSATAWQNILSPTNFSIGGCDPANWVGNTIEVYGSSVYPSDQIYPSWGFSADEMRIEITAPSSGTFVAFGQSETIPSAGVYTFIFGIEDRDGLSLGVSGTFTGDWTINSVEVRDSGVSCNLKTPLLDFISPNLFSLWQASSWNASAPVGWVLSGSSFFDPLVSVQNVCTEGLTGTATATVDVYITSGASYSGNPLYVDVSCTGVYEVANIPHPIVVGAYQLVIPNLPVADIRSKLYISVSCFGVTGAVITGVAITQP